VADDVRLDQFGNLNEDGTLKMNEVKRFRVRKKMTTTSMPPNYLEVSNDSIS
jgi:hypothetical protein